MIQCLFKASPAASIILYPDAPSFTLAWVNPAALLLTGSALTDLVGLSVFEVLAEPVRDIDVLQNETLQNSLAQSLDLKCAATMGLQRYKLVNQIADGNDLECSNYPLFDEAENVAFLVLNLNVVIDQPSIEHQQQLEQQQDQLDAHQKKTSYILERITDGFCSMDEYWNVTYWNREAERILKLPREQIIGHNLWQIYPDFLDSDLNLACQKAKSAYTAIHLEEYFEVQDLWLEISAIPSDQGLSVYFKDVTGKKQNEITISTLNKQNKDFFDLSPVPQFVYSVEDLSFKDVNQAAIANYGYSKADFLSMTIMDITPKEDIPALEQILNEKVKPCVQYKGISRHLKHTGEIMDVNVVGNSIVYKGVSARLIIAVDLTETIQTRLALQRSEQRYKALVQDGSDMVGILNSKGEFLFVNQTTKRILGIAPEFFIGKNAFDFIHEKDQKRFMDTLAQLPHLESMKIPAFLFIDSEGKYRWIDTTVTNMTEDPAVGGIVANSRDVTERIVSEMKIQQSIERFDIVSKATSDAIWDYDATTGSVVWNKAVKTLFGYKRETYTRKWWEDRIHPDDFQRVNKKMMSMIEGKKNRLKNEYRFRCANDSYKNVLDRSFSIYNDSGELIRMIGSMEDITARETYVQTVEAQNERLKEIAWTQSHMVRAPLANIISLTELLTDKMDEDGPHKELIMNLSKSATELDSTIRFIIKKSAIFYNV